MKFQGNGNSGFIKPKGDKMMKKFLLAVLITILLVIFTVGCVEEPETETVESTTSEPTVDKEAELQKAIDRGKELFNDPTLGTTGDTCNSCHLNGGKSPNTEKNIGTFNNLNTVYPKYFQMTSKVMTLDQVNNFCVVTPLEGTPFKWDDQKLTDLTAYVASVESGVKEVPMTESEMEKYQESVNRGKALFNDPNLGSTGDSCSTCHLESGTKTNPEKMMGFTMKAFDDIGKDYPKYWPMANKVMTLDQVINFCIITPLEGEALDLDDQRLADLGAYITSVKSNEKTTKDTQSPSVTKNPDLVDASVLTVGKTIYNTNCRGCHGSDGKGGLPNQPDFTDDSYWKGKNDEDLFDIVSEGKKGSSMPSFKDTLNEDEIRNVLAYGKSLSN